MRIGLAEPGTVFAPPENEIDEIFYDRLKRTKETGRNLFYEEWEPIEMDYGPDIYY